MDVVVLALEASHLLLTVHTIIDSSSCQLIIFRTNEKEQTT
jgi:hypothetical protein